MIENQISLNPGLIEIIIGSPILQISFGNKKPRPKSGLSFSIKNAPLPIVAQASGGTAHLVQCLLAQ
jgi:hypothetical protein